MKKLLGSTLSLAMVFSYSPASAEVLKNFKISGSIEVNSTSADNVSDFRTNVNQATGATGRDNLGDVQTRLIVNADWDLLDDVHAKVTVRKNNRAWARPNGTGNGEDLNTVQTQLIVDQSYFKIDKVADAVDLTAGRQYYNEANSRNEIVAFYGPMDKIFAMTVTAIDAFRFDWSNDQWGLTGLAGRTVDAGLGNGGGNGDTDVRGLIATIKGNEQWNAGAYVWNQVTHRTNAGVGTGPSAGNVGGKNDFLWVAGLKGKVMLEGAWAAIEVAKNFGQRRFAPVGSGSGLESGAQSYTGWAAKLDAGYKAELSGLGTLNPWLHFAQGSGDGSPQDNKTHTFVPIASDYRPGAIWGRFSTVNGMGQQTHLGGNTNVGAVSNGSLGGLRVVGLGLNATPEAANKLTAGLSVYDFTRSFEQQATVPSHLGSEVDLEVTWKHSENVLLGVTLGKFQPGGLFNEAQQAKNASGAGPGSQNSGTGVNAAYLAAFDVKVKF